MNQFLAPINDRYREAGLPIWQSFRQGTVHRSWPKRIVHGDGTPQVITGAGSEPTDPNMAPLPDRADVGIRTAGRRPALDEAVAVGHEDPMTDAGRLATITEQDRHLNSWAFRSFRDIADGDYLAARMAYRAQLPAQFLWASQQALEKYLKCILFIRRISATRVRHHLKPALDLIEQNEIGLSLTERSRAFIGRIDGVGRYRYMEASFFVEWRWILSLDQAVWELRRFCTLDPSATSATLVDGEWAPRVHIAGGFLEKVLRSARTQHASHCCGTTATSGADDGP
jgi:hypothetical protein